MSSNLKPALKSNKLEEPVTDLSDTIKQKKTVTFDENSISQKNCIPGPNVIFSGKKALPLYEYLININKKGTLGCGPEQFPKYENGKYCCVDTMVTNQEQLDYINNLIEAASKNVNETVFRNYAKVIYFLINKRKELLASDHTLIDNIEIPILYRNVDIWFNHLLEMSNKLPKYRPEPAGGKKSKINKTRKNKSKKNKSRKNKSRK
jgi:hypothetical protein